MSSLLAACPEELLPVLLWLLIIVQLYLTGLMFAVAILVRSTSPTLIQDYGRAVIWPYTLVKFLRNRYRNG